MGGSQKHNSDRWLADAVIPLLNCWLKKWLNHSRLDTRRSANLSTDLLNHYSAERMPDEYYRPMQLLNNVSALASPGPNRYRQPTSFPSRLSIKLLSKLLAWSAVSAVVFPNAASALYPNVITRAQGTSLGRKSLSQKAPVWRLVQVFFGSPYRPWTATILGRERKCQYHSWAAMEMSYSALMTSAFPAPFGG